MGKPVHKWTPEHIKRAKALSKSECISLSAAAGRLGWNVVSFMTYNKRQQKEMDEKNSLLIG